MKIIELIRLILKNLALLILVPFLLALLVLLLTSKPNYEYSSETMLYTGLATGSSIEMDKTFNYFATNIAFDNLINIINSRETQEEVAIRLLTLHLMLPEANPKYISKKLYDEFKLKIPTNLYDYIATDQNTPSSTGKLLNINETSNNNFPSEINRANYEKTVSNLTELMKSSNDNFVYEILNYDDDDHYSLKVLSSIKAQRINSSDLIKLSYTINDPGICQQTLTIYNEVCIKNYKHIKENRSDAVVKYFEQQLEYARIALKEAEDKLLEFNKSYKIINYYEQSKAVAVVKEDMEVDYNNKKAELAGTQAATKRLEEKLQIRQQIQLENNEVLDKKRQLGDINYEIALLDPQTGAGNNEETLTLLKKLKQQQETLNKEIKESVNQIYKYENSTDGVPINKVLPDWMNNIVEAENLKAKIRVMDQQNKRFEEQYATYAPAGANIKRIEREISVSEQGYLEILHGLNLAKLKLQDNELSSNLKTIDPPYYPLSPNPTKRAILIIAAAFLGGVLILAIILVMEFFDETLKNSNKASKILNLPTLGMMPKMILDPGSVQLAYVQKRLIEIITQNIIQFFSTHTSEEKVKTIAVLSTQKKEGKTVLAGNIAKTLKSEGKKVLFLNFSDKQESLKQEGKFSFVNKILGYSDPRVDINNPFLANVATYLEPSEFHTIPIDKHFYQAKSYTDIIEKNNIKLDFTPDFVIIELPAFIYSNYPAELMSHTDLDILICRSNRVWTEADQTALSNLLETAESKINFIVNGVNINEAEAILGDLPKKRSNFRKKIKTIFKFQFFNKNEI